MKTPVKWVALAVALVPALALAASWWNNDWKFRKEIGFDLSPAAADIAGTPQDVPVLVCVSALLLASAIWPLPAAWSRWAKGYAIRNKMINA